jgi:predicted anti-sigma-YlaC factor YlaD
MRQILDYLLGAGADDPGCEAAFDVIDEYVEAVMRGEDVTERYASVVAHLQGCDACREDVEALIAAMREIEPLRET